MKSLLAEIAFFWKREEAAVRAEADDLRQLLVLDQGRAAPEANG